MGDLQSSANNRVRANVALAVRSYKVFKDFRSNLYTDLS